VICCNPLSGGGGNRTRVPWHFDRRFYVCSLLIPGVFLAAFAVAGSNGQDPAAAIGRRFNHCGLRGDPPCGEPHAAAILIWRPRRNLSG